MAGVFQCPACDYETRDPKEMREHHRGHHAEKQQARRTQRDRLGTHPQYADDPLERIAWMVNQLRLIAWVWLVLTVIGVIFVASSI